MRYDSDLLYRPPGEWKSYLLQCTIGCSHNKCTFCQMYKTKKFRIRPLKEILEDIDMAREAYTDFSSFPLGIPNVSRVFLCDGDAIAIPNDPVNENRALLLLQAAGLIKLPEGTTLESTCTPADIVENPHNLNIQELNAELIPGVRADVAYAVINGNNATLVDLVPYVDGLYAETADSEAAQAYVNVVVVKPENAEAEWVKALEKVIYTQKVYDLIVESGFAPTFEVAK